MGYESTASGYASIAMGNNSTVVLLQQLLANRSDWFIQDGENWTVSTATTNAEDYISFAILIKPKYCLCNW